MDEVTKMADRHSLSIRHLASSRSGKRIAAAEFEHNVHIWDIVNQRSICHLHTILDFGGRRLAISVDGKLCVIGSYKNHSIAGYEIDTGKELWRRTDVRHPQYISFASNDEEIVIGTDDNICYVLDRSNGASMSVIRDAHRIVENPWRSISFLSGRQMELKDARGVVRVIPRLTFAELDVVFSPGQICVSESGGGVRCFDIDSGAELWRYSNKGCHVVQLYYNHSHNVFFAVEFSYERDGKYRLLRFHALDGQMDVIMELDWAWEAVFCLDGSFIVTAGGSLIETMSGVIAGQLWNPKME